MWLKVETSRAPLQIWCTQGVVLHGLAGFAQAAQGGQLRVPCVDARGRLNL